MDMANGFTYEIDNDARGWRTVTRDEYLKFIELIGYKDPSGEDTLADEYSTRYAGHLVKCRMTRREDA